MEGERRQDRVRCCGSEAQSPQHSVGEDIETDVGVRRRLQDAVGDAQAAMIIEAGTRVWRAKVYRNDGSIQFKELPSVLGTSSSPPPAAPEPRQLPLFPDD